jgi:hypothetical protein
MTSDERRMAVKDEQESFGSREEVIIVAVTFFFVSSTLALTARTFCSHFAVRWDVSLSSHDRITRFVHCSIG